MKQASGLVAVGSVVGVLFDDRGVYGHWGHRVNRG